MRDNTIYTLGHSTRSIDEFIKILQAYGIELVVDVRTIPRSRHNPQFNQSELDLELTRHGIGYLHLAELGGLRHTSQASINTAWTNASFRGFADYMQTSEFEQGIELLIEESRLKQTAILCAEAVPWRCHRSLIGDALLVRNIEVIDILDEKSNQVHKMTPWAKVDGVQITYPARAPAPASENEPDRGNE